MWAGAIRSGAFRAFALYAVFVALLAAAIVAVLFWQTNTLLARMTLQGLAAEAQALARVGGADGMARTGALVAERSQSERLGLYLLLDASGRKLAGNLNRWPPELDDAGHSGLFRYERSGAGEQTLLAVGVPATLADGSRLLVGRDLEEQRGFISEVRRLLLAGVALLGLTALVGGLVASRPLLARVAGMRRTSEAIMAGRLSERIALDGSSPELDELARSLNAMLDRIEQLLSGLREVSDNIAHDLKTPLTRLRNRAEAALRDGRGAAAHRDGLERTIEEADELITTFNAMLLIARLDAGAFEGSVEAVDLGLMVADVAELYEPLAEERGLSLVLALEPGLVLRANRQLIGQAVANLIDNAIKYGVPPAGSAAPRRIDVRVARAGATSVRIEVGDPGIGIAAADRGRALERFVRLEASRTRPGTGLGLSVVAAVARLHGGNVRLEDNAPGLRVILSLPIRDGDAAGAFRPAEGAADVRASAAAPALRST